MDLWPLGVSHTVVIRCTPEPNPKSKPFDMQRDSHRNDGYQQCRLRDKRSSRSTFVHICCAEAMDAPLFDRLSKKWIEKWTITFVGQSGFRSKFANLYLNMKQPRHVLVHFSIHFCKTGSESGSYTVQCSIRFCKTGSNSGPSITSAAPLFDIFLQIWIETWSCSRN